MNVLSKEKQTVIVGALAEGNSIRAIERMSGVHRDTIMRLGVRIGNGCQRILDEKMRNLNCRLLQVDEVWGFVGMKQKTALRNQRKRGVGDVWTWVALDSETKLVPTFAIGDRSGYMADMFIEDLASRLSHRVQISSDALRAYVDAVDVASVAK
jgi:IS1 family transposase